MIYDEFNQFQRAQLSSPTPVVLDTGVKGKPAQFIRFDNLLIINYRSNNQILLRDLDSGFTRTIKGEDGWSEFKLVAVDEIFVYEPHVENELVSILYTAEKPSEPYDRLYEIRLFQSWPGEWTVLSNEFIGAIKEAKAFEILKNETERNSNTF